MAQNNYIKKKDLIKGNFYKCDVSGFSIGRWNGFAFEYIVNKLGKKFIDLAYHWDDGSPYGTVKPLCDYFDSVHEM